MKSLMIERNNKGEGTIILDDTYDIYKYIMDIKFEDDAILNNLSVFILRDLSWIRERVLSLGYHIIEESYSIVYNLYKTKAIDEYRFAFDQIKEKLYLGRIPNNTHLTLPYKGKLKINEALPTWGFHLNSIIFNKSEYIINQPCIIHSALTNVFISDDILSVIKTILADIISNGCSMTSSNYEGKEFKQDIMICNQNLDVLKNDIEFIFDNVKLKLKLSYLFMDSNNLLNQPFSSNGRPNKLHNFTGDILGYPFLRLFNYTVFEY